MGNIEKGENVKYVDLKGVIGLLDFLKKPINGQIVSSFPTINGVEIEFFKVNNCFEFNSIGIIKNDGDPAPYEFQLWNYGYNEPFVILGQKKIFVLEDGVSSSSFSPTKVPAMSGTINNINCIIENTQAYYRSIRPLAENAKIPRNCFTGEEFKTDEFRSWEYVTLNIGEHEFGFYSCTLNNNRQLIIESLTQIKILDFELIVDAIIYCFALISGCLNMGSNLIVQSNRSDYREIQGFKFNKLQDSISSSLDLISPSYQYDLLKLEQLVYFPKEVFSNLIILCLKDKRLLRAIKIITQSRNLSEELSTSAYFVALETVKNIIIEDNTNKIKPFKNEKIAKETIGKLKKLLNEVNDIEFNDKDSILRKLDNIDSIGNNDSFFKAFELLDIKLSKAEKDSIKMRNRFLHGNVPFQDELEDGKVKQLHIIELRTHLLTCALILKYAGFNGFLKNALKFIDNIKFDGSIEEPFFREI